MKIQKLLKTILPQLILLALISCNKDDNPYGDINFRQEMRDFVIGISQYSRSLNSSFIVVPQNGIELVLNDDESSQNQLYLDAIDGNGQEDLFYGYVNDNEPTPSDDNVYLREFLDVSKNAGKLILVTDYCSTPSKMDNSYSQNNTSGYISFAADNRELNDIPSYPSPIYAENNGIINKPDQVKNFLYLINAENYTTKQNFINAIKSTNYDLLIMDLFFNDGNAFTLSEIDQLKNKANGGKRLILAYISIGEAEDYRYYWQSGWNLDQPIWLDAENPDWAGNFKVRYWEPEWQQIIYGNDNSYLKKIVNAGFDGVYLDIIDAFEYFE